MTRRSRHGKPRTSPDWQRPSTARPGQRLQKVLAAAGIASRRECETLILEGRVEVDGRTVTTLGTCVDPQGQEVRVDGVSLSRPRHAYFLVNKPVGVVSTNRDPAGRARVIDLVPSDQRLFTIGRLDRSSEGLIIVTNDGELAHHLSHPRYGVAKTYRARVLGTPAPATLAQLRKGVHLAEGRAQVAALRICGKHRQGVDLEIVLAEGRNREIRRILAKVGHKVQRLKRIAIGPIRLGQLQPGEYRRLTREEIRLLGESVPARPPSAAADRRSASGRSRPKPARASQLAARAGRESEKSPRKGANRDATGRSSRSAKPARDRVPGKKRAGATRTGTVLDYEGERNPPRRRGKKSHPEGKQP